MKSNLFLDRAKGKALNKISLQERIDRQDRDHGDEDLGGVQSLVGDRV